MGKRRGPGRCGGADCRSQGEEQRDGQHRARGQGAAGRGDQQGSVLGYQGAGLQTNEDRVVRREPRCVHWVGGMVTGTLTLPTRHPEAPTRLH